MKEAFHLPCASKTALIYLSMNDRSSLITALTLSVLLPLIGMASQSTTGYLLQYGFYLRWTLSSFSLLLLWNILWQGWNIVYLGEKMGKLALLILALISLITGIVQFAPDNSRGYGLVNVIQFAIPATLFLTIQYGLRVQQSLSELELEKQQLQSEHYKAQLQALQAQVDPHFLFNSLNTLRSMIRNGNDQSEQFIMCLSDFYRQTLQHKQEQTISVEKEIEVLEAFLFLMKSRNRDAIETRISIPSALLERRIPKFSLQILVENCIKHNSMTSRTPLLIDIVDAGEDNIAVRNNIQPKLTDHAPSGHGLNILKKRYELLHVKDGVDIQSNQHHFQVTLKTLPK